MVALAAAVALGALVARPVPMAAMLAVVALALVAGRRLPVLVCAAGLVLASGLGARAWAGTAPVAAHDVDGAVTLVSDPEVVRGATRAVIELEGHRVEAWARGSVGAALGRRLAGEVIEVRGRVTPPPELVARRLAERHIVGRLQVEATGGWSAGSPASRSANRVRRTLVDGAASMGGTERALFTGFVLGDDRAQRPEVVDEFRAAGLSHLTAVSGQNVALTLALAAPLLCRLGLTARWAVTVALVAWFALLTRFEPSVLRASGMAVLTATAFAVGRPASRMRLLALAVAGFVLIDPLLVHSVGWWLSVGATSGIALGAGPLAAVLPGPRAVAEALAVTVAAQVGVAPVSIAVFGGLPLASVPANLAAAPAAGPVVIYGLPAGVVAGLVPDPVATVLHLPTRLFVGWLALVARVAARAPLGELRAAHLAVLAVAIALVVVARRVRLATVAALALSGGVVVAAVVSARPVIGADGVAVAGGHLWRAPGAAVLVVDEPDTRLLAALRTHGIDQLDLVVIAGPDGADALDPILRRHRPRLVLARAGSRIAGARSPPAGTVVAAGALTVEILTEDPLTVRVRRSG